MPANVDEMMYVGQTPWHGKGTKLDNPATAAEAIEAAKLGWDVRLEDVFQQTQDGFRAVSNKKLVVRIDTNVVLGVVGERYCPLQNRDAFRFFDAVVGEKSAIYHTAGSLGDGERIWLLAKLPGEIVVTKDDVTEKYLLLANSHDGTLRVSMLWTPIRVVCQNTLNGALSSAEEVLQAKHTTLLGNRVGEFASRLGIINQKFDLLGELSQRLIKTPMLTEQWKTYRNKVFNISDGELPTRTKNMLDEVSALFDSGRGTDLPGVRGTAWAGVNAIVEYADYVRGRNTTRDMSTLFGSGATLKQKAWKEAALLV